MIHQYKLNDLNIVIDVYSGAVHVVDDIVFDIINLYDDEHTKKDIINSLNQKYEVKLLEEAFEEVETLKEQGLLFTDDIYHDYLPGYYNKNTVVKALCLHIAHDCNLCCKYCFAEEGEYKGDRSMMTEEVGMKAIDFLIENSGNRKNLEIDFFGGEPLMNFDVVKKIVDYARSKEKDANKRFRFTITTNGVLLDEEKQKYINENMHNVVLSIDGRKEVHDNMRPTSNGKGSYELVTPKFIEMAESRNQQNYYVRGTFTSENLDFSKDVLHLADKGFKQISVEPVVASDDMPYALKKEHLPKLFEEYETLANEMIKRKKEGNTFNFFHFMIDLSQGPCVSKRLSGCGSGAEYLAVTPWGDLYPCHQYVGFDEFKMGNVYDGVTNKEKKEQFQRCNVYTKEECKDCWAKFYCSGGCSANGYQFHGDINRTYNIGCELEKKRVECAIILKAMGY